MKREDPILVIGAGVSGLTTAICIAESGRPVRVRAAEPPRRTTSMIAGAMWGPSFQEPVADVLAWTACSLAEFSRIAAQPGTGVRLAVGTTVSQAPMGGELPPQVKLIPELRPCTAAELPPGYATGFRSRVPLVDMPAYLDYLAARLDRAGCGIEVGAVGSLAEAAEEAPVVVDCSGLGARELAGDRSVRPVRGQHVVVRNPGLDEWFMELTDGPEWASIFPHPERVVLGGISIDDSWDTAPDDAFTERLLARCIEIEPRLRDADIIETVVGLRPDRPAVRVERAPLGTGWCVHNYGHGGTGVSLSWGCARTAARLAIG